MSTITTRSKFYFDTGVRLDNRFIDFNEGGPTLFAQMNVGDYTLTEYSQEFARALNESGGQDYTVTLDRDTRKLTVSAPSDFSLLCATGPRLGQSAWTTAGFTGADRTGSNSYEGDLGAGKEYQTQYPIEAFTQKSHSIVLENGSYSATPVGTAQVANFADGFRIPMNIRVITNKTNLKNVNFYENVNGIDDFMYFINRCMRRDRIEFMPNVNDSNAFNRILLESTSEDRQGLEFELKNMDTANFYESGRLIFRGLLI